MNDEEVEMREKYPLAAELLEDIIRIICDAYNLKVYGPTHDVAGGILEEFFIEEGKEG